MKIKSLTSCVNHVWTTISLWHLSVKKTTDNTKKEKKKKKIGKKKDTDSRVVEIGSLIQQYHRGYCQKNPQYHSPGRYIQRQTLTKILKLHVTR